jgi:hypothetical protein
VLAAEQHASRLVLPASKRTAATRWPSRKDHAAKALAKLAGPHLPVSLAKLERAVTRTHRAYEEANRVESTADRDADVEPDADNTIDDEELGCDE